MTKGVRCIDCQRIDVEKHQRHAEVGLGLCNIKVIPGQFQVVTRHRTCEWFLPVKEVKNG